MTPLKYKDLKEGMIVALKDGTTGRVKRVYPSYGMASIIWSSEKYGHMIKDTPLFHPHTTESTYIDGVQVVRLVVLSSGEIYQQSGSGLIKTPFNTKPNSPIHWMLMSAKMSFGLPVHELDIDRKITRVRNAKP